MIVLLGAAALTAMFWLLVVALPLRRFPRQHFLRRARPAEPPPQVVAVVPARDEAVVLPETLSALLRQDYPRYRIVVVDDGSSDGTAALARRLGEEPGAAQLEVIDAGAKPPGWAGKMHALARGVEAVLGDGAESDVSATETAGGEGRPLPDDSPGRAAPEWLLLTDADIRHPPSSLSSLVAKAQRGGYDLVSVMSRLSTRGRWERLLVPPFVYFFHLLYPFRAVSRRSSSVAAAAGGCVLVRASALMAAGGFAAIRDALIDDIALAKLLKSKRRRLWLGLDAEIESVRRYGLGDLWRMVARSAFVQLEHRYTLVPAVFLGLAFFFAGPSVIVVSSVAALALEWGGTLAWATLALAAVARTLETIALLPWVRHHGIRNAIWWSLTFPLAALLYGGMTVHSAWRHLRGRGSAWKGRGYERAADTFTAQ